MKKHYFLRSIFFLSLFTLFTFCGSDDNDDYTDVPDPAPVSPVVMDLATVPYNKLSDYKFYEGDLQNMQPAYKVLPYDLNSKLFTDYAHKKRFIWMPEGSKATYIADGQILDFPTGTAIIKNFYYENVLPDNSTRIIETRLLIKKADGWIFAEYVWNDEQTEAYLDLDGSYTDISWMENGTEKSANYRVPSETECLTCHKTDDNPIPIGPKPQNLNKMFTYTDGAANQLSRWITEGYLQDNLPASINSTVNWADASQPLELRVRSYMDINCAHCHAEGAHCDYMPIRLAFTETTSATNMGVCVEPNEFINTSLSHIVAKKNTGRSTMYYRLSTTDESERMPMLGRSLVHEEGLELFAEWINAMDEPCP
ncbi:hypothetical protein [Flavobacterium litorale]|uniref:Repeat protein (TIGR03806 family) n=1 Tax=Flavobacterium litorale TaxID=2856519 RepID=A0ABX8V5S9_9FLAO|nr:hypothetical protein [Flavobacterium litorale]QYJ68194.1 hypothetical protein K1I41_11800 [Flavobacterium litorale]